MIIDQLFEAPQQCPECGGISFSDLILAEKKDACYYKVKASAKVWPSAYASGRLVQCRKKGAANYGKSKTESVAEEESEAESERRRYPNYYQHKDRGTVFKVQSPDGKTKTVPPDDEKWDDYYQKKFKGMPTPNDGGFWNDDDTAAMVEGSAGQVVFSGTGADGGTYEIIQSGPTDFMIHANGKHIDTYGSLQRAMSVLKNEVPGLQQGVAEQQELDEKWSQKYKSSINCANPKGFSQKAHCAGRKKNEDVAEGWRDIYNLNKQKIGTNPNLIKPDTVLKMPDGSRYKVKPGDNLSSIAKTTGAKSAQPLTSTSPKAAAEPKYYSLPPGAAAAVKPAPVKPAGAQDDNPVIFDLKSGQGRVKPDRIADVFQNPKLPPPLTRDEIEQQMMQPDYAGPNAPGYKHIVTGQDGEEHQFDSGEEAKDFVNKIEQLRLQDREQGGLGAAKSESVNSTVKEVSLGDYRKKAAVSQAGAKINKFFDRDNPEKVAAADQTIAKRERGLARADARHKPYTSPSVDKEKQRQQLTDKYPNIDELVSNAEKNRDPYYDRAEGNAYYAGREAEQNYVRLKQIQRIIQGLNEETRQATLNTPVGDFTANITKDKSTNTVSGTMPIGGTTLRATKDMTPGGAQSFSVDTDVAPNLNLSATKKSADYNKGELAGTKSATAKYTDTAGTFGQPGKQYTATRTAGVGFGGASGPRVGKNYVDQYDKTLADYIKEANGITEQGKPPPGRPFDLPPLEGGGGGGGGGGRSGPSPFGPKPGSREASIAQPNANTMTIKQGPNPDYRPPSQQSQITGDKPKIKVNPGETVPQAIERTKTQQEFGKFLQGQSGQTFGAGAGRGSVNPAPANTMANTPVSVKNKPSAMNSMARDLTNPPKPNNTNTTTTTTNNSPRQNDRVDPLDMPRDPYMPRDPFDMVRPGYDGYLGSNPRLPNTRDKQSSWLGKAGKTLGYGAAAYGAADVGSRAWDYYDQTKDMPSVKEAKKQSPEVEYDDEYDAMVARVKKLAGLGPMKTVYDPKKRQYRNMPTAVQPQKK